MLNKQTIYEFKKNLYETVRFGFTNFKGTDILSIWVFYNNDGDSSEWKPSRKGISLQAKHIFELKKGIDKACEKYQEQETS